MCVYTLTHNVCVHEQCVQFRFQGLGLGLGLGAWLLDLPPEGQFCGKLQIEGVRTRGHVLQRCSVKRPSPPATGGREGGGREEKERGGQRGGVWMDGGREGGRVGGREGSISVKFADC
jgi:hypothetical protein